MELDPKEKGMWEMEETRAEGEFEGEFVGSSAEPCGQREEAECHGRERKYFLQWYFGGI